LPRCALHLRSKCTFLPRALLRQPASTAERPGRQMLATAENCKLSLSAVRHVLRLAAPLPLQGLSSLAQGPTSDTAHLLGRRSANARTGAMCRICGWSCLRPYSAEARGLPHPATGESARLCWEHGAEGRCKAPRSLQSAAGLAILGVLLCVKEMVSFAKVREEDSVTRRALRFTVKETSACTPPLPSC